MHQLTTTAKHLQRISEHFPLSQSATECIPSIRLCSPLRSRALLLVGTLSLSRALLRSRSRAHARCCSCAVARARSHSFSLALFLSRTRSRTLALARSRAFARAFSLARSVPRSLALALFFKYHRASLSAGQRLNENQTKGFSLLACWRVMFLISLACC